MTDNIHPALTPEEWKEQYAVRPEGTAMWPISFHREYRGLHIPVTADVALTVEKPKTIIAIMAAANASLPDDDPRKLTRDMVDDLRDAAAFYADNHRSSMFRAVKRVADAIEAILPPRGAARP
jgi:hypothetical protein